MMIIPFQVFKILDNSEQYTSEQIVDVIEKLKNKKISVQENKIEQVKDNFDTSKETEELVNKISEKRKVLEQQGAESLAELILQKKNSAFSIKKQLETDNEKIVSDKENKEIVLEPVKSDLTIEEIQKHWDKLAKSKASDNLWLFQAMSAAKLSLKKTQLKVMVGTNVLASDLENYLFNITSELNKSLKPHIIKIKIELDEKIKKESKPYTQEDIYKHMIKENPSLAILVEKLSLSF